MMTDKVCPCGKPVESKHGSAVYCNACREIKIAHRKARYFVVREIRSEFANLALTDLDTARELRGEMLAKEGPEFTEMALDGITEHVATQDAEHKKHIQKRVDRHRRDIQRHRLRRRLTL